MMFTFPISVPSSGVTMTALLKPIATRTVPVSFGPPPYDIAIPLPRAVGWVRAIRAVDGGFVADVDLNDDATATLLDRSRHDRVSIGACPMACSEHGVARLESVVLENLPCIAKDPQ